MLKINQDDYAYATARIRAKEVKLLNSSQFDRMLEASTAEEAYKVLAEADYGMATDNTKDVFSYETVLAEEMEKAYLLLSEIAPQKGIVEAFKRRHDFFNIKVIIKAELSNQEIPSILIETGSYDKETILRIIRERDYDELTPIMREAIVEVYDVFSRTKDPQAIDLILDRAAYKQFIKELKEIDNGFINELADIIVDITNIKIFIRVRALNKSWNFIKRILLAGGKIEEDVYLNNSDKPVGDFINEIRTTEYGDAIQKDFKNKANKNIQAFEKLFDDFLMKYMHKAKMITMGVEPFVAYLFAKEAEIRNVRIVLTGKINGLSNHLIRERLRLIYV